MHVKSISLKTFLLAKLKCAIHLSVLVFCHIDFSDLKVGVSKALAFLFFQLNDNFSF